MQAGRGRYSAEYKPSSVSCLCIETGGNHFSGTRVAARLKRTNFSLPKNRKTLFFLRAGFTALLRRRRRKTVAFVYRTKTSVHFSPFILHSRTSIVSVALSRPDYVGRWVLPTTLVMHLLSCPRTLRSAHSAKYIHGSSDFPPLPR